MSTESLPLLQHALQSPSAFTPERLRAAVRADRGLAQEAVPPLCVLDFDGDLSDQLAAEGITAPWASWACFHTSMRVATIDGLACGIVPHTIGGPYAVLVTDQLRAAGAKLIVGITSAGRVSRDLPLPSIRHRGRGHQRRRDLAALPGAIAECPHPDDEHRRPAHAGTEHQRPSATDLIGAGLAIAGAPVSIGFAQRGP
jgi:hypothetical protein